MTTLLTGASGFIGSELLKRQDISFRIVTRNPPPHDGLEYFFTESIDSFTDWTGAFEGVTSVLHLAGLAHSTCQSATAFDEINFRGTTRLAEEARRQGVKRFVFVSSIGVNGMATKDQPFTQDSVEEPHNLYTQSKYKAEVGLKKIEKEMGLEVVIVRPTLVYGSGAPGNFGMLTKLVKSLPILPFGLANNRRDFISVQNLADLLVTCVNHPEAGGHTFLASENHTVSIKEFTNAIAEGLGTNVIQLPIPVGLMRLAGQLSGKSTLIEQLFGNLEVSSSNIQEVLGWTPPFTMKQAMASLCNTGK
ncbi:3-beta hydroxysteroid dehydrogenase/isomerase family protein [Vibrio cholerae]|uniref:NAD-dependent epimerase/dehydratase family protein n=1 Tax=Vibrio cholerae TaxID=666 RepID=UPI000E0B2F63|nr:NAD-dependent epimerase/dehydratase family protein [Vibrio cholerae]MBU5690543.1 NAD-dependent epimerase/dehydratase family protein [Vibrio cholerae]MCD1193114.1 UDP-glucose 4-epimerase [Vibrio cholerae]MCD6670087.1 NAD-dependent epimerase/dehydratase family protein [Vibrio cholerae]TQQ68716.1 NAD-dependent epimerase/dehydratase family protein [Vibrio cholerae]BCN19209.1 putative epimerase [Vibrio cholerae]